MLSLRENKNLSERINDLENEMTELKDIMEKNNNLIDYLEDRVKDINEITNHNVELKLRINKYLDEKKIFIKKINKKEKEYKEIIEELKQKLNENTYIEIFQKSLNFKSEFNDILNKLKNLDYIDYEVYLDISLIPMIKKSTEIHSKMIEHIIKLKNEIIKNNNDDLCKICKVFKQNAACNPCGHLCMCMDCSRKVDKCPICRVYFSNILQIRK